MLGLVGVHLEDLAHPWEEQPLQDEHSSSVSEHPTRSMNRPEDDLLTVPPLWLPALLKLQSRSCRQQASLCPLPQKPW